MVVVEGGGGSSEQPCRGAVKGTTVTRHTISKRRSTYRAREPASPASLRTHPGKAAVITTDHSLPPT